MYLEKHTQLFLLHFAGGNIYSFNFLKRFINPAFEFISLELPGRGMRHQEKLLRVKKDTITDLVNQVKKLRNGNPYIIFGHSMGATLGLSVANEMEKIGDLPNALIVSGNAGPGLPKEDKPKRYSLEDNEFKEALKKLGGVPQELLENDELFNFFSPIMRADFEALEKDDFLERDIKLKTPIYALMGSEEKTCDKIENWQNFTTGNFQCKVLPGNHFYIYDHPTELAGIITNFSHSSVFKE